MRLIDDWKYVLRWAWSIRLIAAAIVFSGLEVALPLMDGLLPVPRGVFAVLSGLTSAAAFASRLLAQKKAGE